MKNINTIAEELNVKVKTVKEIFVEAKRISYATKHFYKTLLIYLDRIGKNNENVNQNKLKLYDYACEYVLTQH